MVSRPSICKQCTKTVGQAFQAPDQQRVFIKASVKRAKVLTLVVALPIQEALDVEAG